MALRKHIYADFRQGAPSYPINRTTKLHVLSASSDAVICDMLGPSGVPFQVRYEQQNSQLIPTYIEDPNCCTGWELPLDNTSAEGVEITNGIAADANMPYVFKIGTDAAFEFRVKCGIPDPTDHTVFAIGFRTAATYGDAIASEANFSTAYGGSTDEYACFNINNGAIKTMCEASGGAQSSVDTTNTWAADAVKTLTVKVSASGVVSFLIDGAAPTVNTNALTFANNSLVIPFVYVAQDVTAAADTPPILQTWFVGLTE